MLAVRGGRCDHSTTAGDDPRASLSRTPMHKHRRSNQWLPQAARLQTSAVDGSRTSAAWELEMAHSCDDGSISPRLAGDSKSIKPERARLADQRPKLVRLRH